MDFWLSRTQQELCLLFPCKAWLFEESVRDHNPRVLADGFFFWGSLGRVFSVFSHRAIGGPGQSVWLKRLASTASEILREKQTASNLSESSSKDSEASHWWHTRSKGHNCSLLTSVQYCKLFFYWSKNVYILRCLRLVSLFVVCLFSIFVLDRFRRKEKKIRGDFCCFPLHKSSDFIAKKRGKKASTYLHGLWKAIKGLLHTLTLRRNNWKKRMQLYSTVHTIKSVTTTELCKNALPTGLNT